jgi:predicted nucleic acid-binding protein
VGTYFLDTSAVVKCYVPEQGQSFVVNLCDPERGHGLYISQVTLVEVVTSICRKAHEKVFTPAERDTLIKVFRADCSNIYGVRLLTTAMCTAAGDLCRIHRLRAYDAMQLTCALDLRDEAKTRDVPELVFVCADNNLLNVARAEGLMVENPNNYS